MRREIKFRFWNHIVNRMSEVYTLEQLHKEKVTWTNVIELQYTGLQDKNGKEVFEGDIIKWKTTRYHNEEHQKKQVAMPKFFISPVLFHEGSFLVNESDKVCLDVEIYDTFLICFFSDSMDNKFDFKAEVIGNIYQNPELLNK